MKTLVIDAGHGGSDPGAIGQDGTKEKDLTFELAKIVADKCKQKNIKYILTREEDIDLPLYKRIKVINKMEDVLTVLSIHFNASDNRGANGSEVWCYKKYDDNELLNRIYLKADMIKNKLSTIFKDRGVKYLVGGGRTESNRMALVIKTKCPVILVEICFVTNLDDMKKYRETKEGHALGNKEYIAWSLIDAMIW